MELLKFILSYFVIFNCFGNIVQIKIFFVNRYRLQIEYISTVMPEIKVLESLLFKITINTF